MCPLDAMRLYTGGDNGSCNLGPFMPSTFSVTSFDPSSPPIDRHGQMKRAAGRHTLVTKRTFWVELSVLSRSYVALVQ